MSLLSRVLLLSPRRVEENLERVRAAGVAPIPNRRQLTRGVLRMWRRIVFRPETIGMSRAPVRDNWRARLLAYRPLRFPFLLAERAVAPWDLTGLWSSPERLVRHLLGAHHDGAQFAYDLEVLACYPGALERLHHEVKRVVEHDEPRSRWLRDLTVYEGYHESLLAAVEMVRAGQPLLDAESAGDPDISFYAYLAWCAEQPAC